MKIRDTDGDLIDAQYLQALFDADLFHCCHGMVVATTGEDGVSEIDPAKRPSDYGIRALGMDEYMTAGPEEITVPVTQEDVALLGAGVKTVKDGGPTRIVLEPEKP